MSTRSTKKIYYDLLPDDATPKPGNYLVSVGKKGIGSVWLIKEVRLVKSKVESCFCRHSLTVYPMPELKPLADLEGDTEGCKVWVKGEEALPIVWWPRTKKAQS
ncbi:hypothetical protein [Spirosoma pomorum]